MESIPGFEIREKLGEGGMGVVYLARQLSLDRLVALKVLLPENAKDDVFLRRFRQEAKALRDVVHQNVVRLLDYDLSAQRPYLVFEYIEGGRTLADLIEDEPPLLAEALRLGDRIATGLAHLHDLGMMHRDLKPANILIPPSGEPKIIDLGLARTVVADETRVTVEGQVLGTLAYMPPEQMLGEEQTSRSDVYALGLILYELAARKLVFGGKRPVVSFHVRVNAQVPPLKRFNPDVPLGLCQLIERCLAIDPKVRPSDSAGVRHMIARFVETNKVSLPQSGGSADLQELPQRPQRVEIRTVKIKPLDGPPQTADRDGEPVERRIVKESPGHQRPRPETYSRVPALAFIAFAALISLGIARSVGLVSTPETASTASTPGVAASPSKDSAPTLRELGLGLIPRLEKARLSIDLAWLDSFARRQANLIRSRSAPEDVAAVIRAQFVRAGLQPSLDEFLARATTYFETVEIPEAERWAVRSALADVEVIEAFCDEHAIPWKSVCARSVSRCAGTLDDQPKPWTMPIRKARTWLRSPATTSERFFPGRTIADEWLLDELPGDQRALVWFALLRWRPGLVIDLLVNKRFRRVLRYRPPPPTVPPIPLELVEWHLPDSIARGRQAELFADEPPEIRGIVAAWLPARFVTRRTEIKIRLVDLPLSRVSAQNGAMLGRLVSFVPN